MSLIYVLIASGEKVLCDYSPYHGTFEQISLKILSKVRPNTTASFEYSNSYIFYYLNSEGITYLCMTDLDYPKKAATSFLESIKKEFTQTYPKKDFNKIGNFELNKFFKKKMSIKLEYYNKNKNESFDETEQLRKKLVEYQKQVLDSNDILNQREDKITLIVQKEEMLSKESNDFYTKARTIKRKVNYKKIQEIAIISTVILVIIYLILAIICGWTFKKCGKAS